MDMEEPQNQGERRRALESPEQQHRPGPPGVGEGQDLHPLRPPRPVQHRARLLQPQETLSSSACQRRAGDHHRLLSSSRHLPCRQPPPELGPIHQQQPDRPHPRGLPRAALQVSHLPQLPGELLPGCCALDGWSRATKTRRVSLPSRSSEVSAAPSPPLLSPPPLPPLPLFSLSPLSLPTNGHSPRNKITPLYLAPAPPPTPYLPPLPPLPPSRR
eukprot:759667-Hanusia_phi.AAC.2